MYFLRELGSRCDDHGLQRRGDLYDTGAVGDPSHHLHDFEHGIAHSGLFWTLAIPASAISFDVTTCRARFHARNVRLKDYHDIVNAIAGGGPRPVPSHVSFDVRWHGHGRHRRIRDKKFGFEGRLITGRTTVAGSSAIGHERNGVFFR